MAGEAQKIFACRGAKTGSTAINGVTHAALSPRVTKVIDPGPAGTPGQSESVVVDRGLGVSLFGHDMPTLLALVGTAKATIILQIYGPAGALQKLTLTNVYWNEVLGEMSVPAKDGGGKVPAFGIRGEVEWGANDTFAAVLVAAADA